MINTAGAGSMCTGTPVGEESHRSSPNACQQTPQQPPQPFSAYGPEVIGREVKVCRPSIGQSGRSSRWEPGTLTQFDAPSGTHLITYSNSSLASEWLQLDTIKFQWQDVPHPAQASNPSYATSPKGVDAVGRHIRVFWPGMMRWYLGVVRSYDPKKDMHTVEYYEDGESYDHVLRHEAVQWPAAGSPTAKHLRQQQLRQQQQQHLQAGEAAETKLAMQQHAVHIQATRVKRPRLMTNAPVKLPKLTAVDVSGSSALDSRKETPTSLQPSTPYPSQQQRMVCTPSASMEQLANIVVNPNSHASSVKQPQQQQAVLQQQDTNSQQQSAMLTVQAGKPIVAVQQSPAYSSIAPVLLLGVRVAVNTSAGTRHGKIVEWQASSGQHVVRSDDGVSESASLTSSKWQWLSPRTRSAGLTPALLSALRKYGAANVIPTSTNNTTISPDTANDQAKLAANGLPVPKEGPPTAEVGNAPSEVQAAAGRKLWVWCGGEGKWHAGIVLDCSAASTGRCHVLYEDGEDEWMMLNDEVVTWEPSAAAVNSSSQSTETTAHATASAGCPDTSQLTRNGIGLPPGVSVPTGKAAVGWRVAIYWPEDQTLYHGTVSECLPHDRNTEYEVVYDDGQVETLDLAKETVVWRCKTAGTVSVQHQMRPSGDCSNRRSSRRRQRLATKTASADGQPACRTAGDCGSSEPCGNKHGCVGAATATGEQVEEKAGLLASLQQLSQNAKDTTEDQVAKQQQPPADEVAEQQVGDMSVRDTAELAVLPETAHEDTMALDSGDAIVQIQIHDQQGKQGNLSRAVSVCAVTDKHEGACKENMGPPVMHQSMRQMQPVV